MIKKNIFSIITALIICYLSLSNAGEYNKLSLLNFPGSDYLVHFLMYSGFMSVIVFENRQNILGVKNLFLLALIPFFYGIIMELFQLWFTITRTGSIPDILFNSAGIVGVLLVCLVLKPIRKKLFR